MPHARAKSKIVTDIAVIILTYNEESNIAQALESVQGWSRQVFLLDSYSTDRTLEIAGRYPCTIVQNRFENYSKQRNFALEHLPIVSEWVFFLDADEWIPPELREEISTLIASNPPENGFFVKWRLFWMGRWIRRGYYPTWILRLFRFGKARCEDRSINEHLVVEGGTGYLKNDFIHEDHKGVTDWVAKHNGYATREASELLIRSSSDLQIDVRLWGTQAERKRWLRYRLWNNLPPLVRPFLYFVYRYVFRGGFLDGKAAFVYHFLQGLWFPMLIDIKYLEMKYGRENQAEVINV
ncbi:MAG: glycosyltransferase family 2 protein [Myxococcales bacterium]|nr:MAG: glycosyltransferase family 2 protein [Myxococcales bacterium]